ncbi:MAG: SEC-C domain-containing protein [Clostridiales Family XIII bacterium]|jgi:hypothetical protein|nr:SEC-C domain-containing protein [Clostridiales Family XIII bacterium]
MSRNESDYNKTFNRISKENDVLIASFNQSLMDAGLAESTIKKHMFNVNLFLNDFLLNYSLMDAKEGISEVISFFDWYLRKCMWSSANDAKKIATSIKKFYKYLCDRGDITTDALSQMKEQFKERFQECIDEINKFNDPAFDWDAYENEECNLGFDDDDENENATIDSFSDVNPIKSEHNVFNFIENSDNLSELEKLEQWQHPETVFGMKIIGRSQIYDLRSLLKKYKIASLRDIATTMKIDNVKSLKEAALVDVLYNKYMSAHFFDQIIEMASEEQLLYLDELMTSDGEYHVTDEAFPYDLALILLELNLITAYFDGFDIYIIVLKETYEKYAEFKDSVNDAANDMIRDVDSYASAAVNLYGVISITDFIDLYFSKTSTGEDLEPNQIETLLHKVIDLYDANDNVAAFYIEKDLLVNETFAGSTYKEIKDYLLYVNRHPRNIFPIKEFIKYEDYYYVEETDAHLQLIQFLAKKCDSDRDSNEDAKSIVGEINSYIRLNAPMQEVIDEIIEPSGVVFDSVEDLNTFTKLYMNVHNNTRIWDNNGSTPNEIIKNHSNVIPRASHFKKKNKIGRNDPCPCGSGKKYKNCCGKLLN